MNHSKFGGTAQLGDKLDTVVPDDVQHIDCVNGMLIHTNTRARIRKWAPKTVTLGNGEFPKPQSAWEGEGSHGKAGCLHAVPLSEPTGPKLKQTELRKDESKIIHILIWHRRVTASDGSKANERDSYAQTHSVVSQLAGPSSRHVGWGRTIIGLLPAWHSLGKPKSEDKVSVRASKVWECLCQGALIGEGIARWKCWMAWDGGGCLVGWIKVRRRLQVFT